MDERRPRERELVLAPNEYAYVLDTTKGHISCYVGPNKTSLAQTDQPVVFDAATGRFDYVELSAAVQLFPTAVRNAYVVLENPAADGSHPKLGVSSALVELRMGEKINIPGPASFPLWPGQTARVLQGHQLRSNQYLTLRVYDVPSARKGWNEAVGAAPDAELPDFQVGEERILRGSELQFFVPPTGVEVVPDEDGRHVRDAVTLQRLEYCVLIGEDGRKTFVRGESVVFPEPTQRFLLRRVAGRRATPVMRAIELSETTGIHVKVVAPYRDDDGDHVEGEELFVTGRNRIYFPREEHAIVRYGRHLLHHAVAVPRGDGRYLLDRGTGEVSIVAGPCMLLPDPRHHVITRRVLTDRECRLLYPSNDEALAFNRRLRRGEPGRQSPLEARDQVESRPVADTALAALVELGTDSTGQDIERGAEFVEPRTITLDTSYAGVVSVSVWPGYAVQVVDRVGERRVVVGPATVMLSFDETLAALSLSTGTPKSDARPLETGYLKVAGNKITDRVDIVTRDLVQMSVELVYRVTFQGARPELWFGVDNYVKLLCDRAGSIVKSVLRKASVLDVQHHLTEAIRDALLGARSEDGGRRGLLFQENGMLLYDVDVLDVTVDDEHIDELLSEAQETAIRQAIEVRDAEGQAVRLQRLSELERARLEASNQTRRLEVALGADLASQQHAVALTAQQAAAALQTAENEAALEHARQRAELLARQLEAEQAKARAELESLRQRQSLRLEELEARVQASTLHAQAWSPALVQAVQRLGDEQLLASLSQNFGELAAVEGKGLLQTARKFLDFVPNGFLPQLAGRAEE